MMAMFGFATGDVLGVKAGPRAVAHTDYRVAAPDSILMVRLAGAPRFQVGDRSVWRVTRAHVFG